ncbi:MAG TPA: protein-glutamate O-methyltransferase CheR, partial [Burkholderiaceae bacterium]|nr:protein-glutamate O-methyltransferase CheR [Burkholderiaceae bacterium]
MNATPATDDELAAFLEVVFRTYHYDFRLYAAASLKRRLTVALNNFGVENLGALAVRIEHDAAVFTELLRFLTVQVSDLFRDPSYFRAIRETVVPYLGT